MVSSINLSGRQIVEIRDLSGDQMLRGMQDITTFAKDRTLKVST